MTGILRKKFWLFLVLLTFNQIIIGQKPNDLCIDLQESSYLVFDQEILKHNYPSHSDFRYSNKLLGNIHALDVTNPLRPLIFFKDVQKLVVTDNTLSNQNQEVISFEELDMYQILCVASSRIDNGIWIYDQEFFQIVKLSRTLERVIETGNLKQILNLENLSPVNMMERNGYLYLLCENNGILIFDIYGTYYKTIPVHDVMTWNVIDNVIYYVTPKGCFKYQIKAFENEEIILESQPRATIKWIDNQSVYFLNDQQKIGSIHFQ